MQGFAIIFTSSSHICISKVFCKVSAHADCSYCLYTASATKMDKKKISHNLMFVKSQQKLYSVSDCISPCSEQRLSFEIHFSGSSQPCQKMQRACKVGKNNFKWCYPMSKNILYVSCPRVSNSLFQQLVREEMSVCHCMELGISLVTCIYTCTVNAFWLFK